jgi:hypothetical protein
MSKILLVVVAALTMLLPTTTIVYGQLLQEEEMGSVVEPRPCDSQKESDLVSGLGNTIRNEVSIECATTNLIILRFEETGASLGWNAIEHFKTKGNFTIDDITASGMGSQGNPTRFYAIMSK